MGFPQYTLPRVLKQADGFPDCLVSHHPSPPSFDRIFLAIPTVPLLRRTPARSTPHLDEDRLPLLSLTTRPQTRLRPFFPSLVSVPLPVL